MGLINVIKLANDYNKAKKVLENNKAKVKDIENVIVKVQLFILELNEFIKNLKNTVDKAKALLAKLADKLQKGDK